MVAVPSNLLLDVKVDSGEFCSAVTTNVGDCYLLRMRWLQWLLGCYGLVDGWIVAGPSNLLLDVKVNALTALL